VVCSRRDVDRLTNALVVLGAKRLLPTRTGALRAHFIGVNVRRRNGADISSLSDSAVLDRILATSQPGRGRPWVAGKLGALYVQGNRGAVFQGEQPCVG